MAQDLADMDTRGLEEILPFVGVLSMAADRITRLSPAHEAVPGDHWKGDLDHALSGSLPASLSQPHPADERVVEALRAKVEGIRRRVEKTICPTFSSDAGDIGEQGRISRQDFDTLVLAALSAKEGW
jgi:hypothetical protein